MARGKFIVFEGIDGCGKGTQAILACNYIFNKDKRNDVLLTREPTRENQQIRNKMSQENDVKREQKTKSYRGLRHAIGLPVRGQRTKSNFRRNKGKAVGGKKKTAMRK